MHSYLNAETYPSLDRLDALAEATGRSALWFVGGVSEGASQDLSEPHLTIAVEIANDIIRAEGVRYVPNGLYARLLKLMYEGVSQGLPVAEVYEFGREIAAAANSGATGERNDVGKQGLGGAGQGGRR